MSFDIFEFDFLLSLKWAYLLLDPKKIICRENFWGQFLIHNNQMTATQVNLTQHWSCCQVFKACQSHTTGTVPVWIVLTVRFLMLLVPLARRRVKMEVLSHCSKKLRVKCLQLRIVHQHVWGGRHDTQEGHTLQQLYLPQKNLPASTSVFVAITRVFRKVNNKPLLSIWLLVSFSTARCQSLYVIETTEVARVLPE